MAGAHNMVLAVTFNIFYIARRLLECQNPLAFSSLMNEFDMLVLLIYTEF